MKMPLEKRNNETRILRKRDVAVSVVLSLVFAIVAVFLAGGDSGRQSTSAKTALPDKSGFTLIEISIVLVIIGLIVGGILAGQEMVHQAKLRSALSQKEKFETAINTFYGKYGCVPGDCGNASTFGFTDAVWGSGCGPGNCTAINGNGDGMIGTPVGYVTDCNSGYCLTDGYTNSPGAERARAWQELQQANLISGYSASLPNIGFGAGPYTPIDGTQWFIGYANGSYTSSGYTGPTGQTAVAGNMLVILGPPGTSAYGGGGQTKEAMTAFDASELDAKIDDGLPFTGNVIATASGSWLEQAPLGNTNVPNNGCVPGSYYATLQNVYLTTTNPNSCNIAFRVGGAR